MSELRKYAEKIQQGLDEADENNAGGGWYSFVSRYDLENLVAAVLAREDVEDSLPPCTCLERSPGFCGH